MARAKASSVAPALALSESRGVRATLIGAALVFFIFFLLLPLIVVFAEALRQGFRAYWSGLGDPKRSPQ